MISTKNDSQDNWNENGYVRCLFGLAYFLRDGYTSNCGKQLILLFHNYSPVSLKAVHIKAATRNTIYMLNFDNTFEWRMVK